MKLFFLPHNAIEIWQELVQLKHFYQLKKKPFLSMCMTLDVYVIATKPPHPQLNILKCKYVLYNIFRTKQMFFTKLFCIEIHFRAM